ncbi:hypothetical protein CAL7716_034420 [Calothrix sp. PCC 7716]|nr:hypothetical protein CAL7716_034420 [Calothrix sp. PCC 7716]
MRASYYLHWYGAKAIEVGRSEKYDVIFDTDNKLFYTYTVDICQNFKLYKRASPYKSGEQTSNISVMSH